MKRERPESISEAAERASANTAGYPSPAINHVETPLDLNELLIHHPAATFFVRAVGNSMVSFGIHHGDLLVVDRSLDPNHLNIVIAIINGKWMVRQFGKYGKRVEPDHSQKQCDFIDNNSNSELQIWGVVTHVIHKL